jgi:hypothetical protein
MLALVDLTRVKSTRACLPLAGALPRPPRQARPDLQTSAQAETPLPAGLRPPAIGPCEPPPEVRQPGPLAAPKSGAISASPAGWSLRRKSFAQFQQFQTDRKNLCADRPNQTARPGLLAGFGPRQIQPRLPVRGQARSRPPGQARPDLPASGVRIAPCQRACALWQRPGGPSTGRSADRAGATKQGLCGLGWVPPCYRLARVIAGITPSSPNPTGPAPPRLSPSSLDTNLPDKLMAPCLRACALRQSDPANLHWRFACRVLCQRPIPKKRLIQPK